MKEKIKKKKYEKPELKSIQLHAEEVLVAGCKSISSGGPSQASCVTGGPACIGSGS
jgi:hypothetical protein